MLGTICSLLTLRTVRVGWRTPRKKIKKIKKEREVPGSPGQNDRELGVEFMVGVCLGGERSRQCMRVSLDPHQEQARGSQLT
jgi:hypothetical protein